MIKIRLEKAANGIIFQILSMPEQLRSNLLHRFKSTCGYTLMSSAEPELDIASKAIFLFGERTHKDHQVVVARLNTSEVDQVHEDIITTFREFVQSDVYKSLTQYGESKDYGPNTLSFDDNNIVIRLERAECGLIFQVLESPEIIRGLPAIETPYLTVNSIGYPQLSDTKLLLRGANREKDRVVVIHQTASQVARDKLYTRVIDTIQTLVHTREYQMLVHPTHLPTSVYTFE